MICPADEFDGQPPEARGAVEQRGHLVGWVFFFFFLGGGWGGICFFLFVCFCWLVLFMFL